MKRFAFRLLVSLLTLTAGLGSAAIWQHYWPPSMEKFTGNQKYYAGREVRFRAFLDLAEFDARGSDLQTSVYTAGAPCLEDECWASVEFDNDVREAGLEPYHIVMVRGSEPPPQPVRTADVVIVGIMDPPYGIASCAGSHFRFRHARIERVIRKYEFGSLEDAANWFKQIRR